MFVFPSLSVGTSFTSPSLPASMVSPSLPLGACSMISYCGKSLHWAWRKEKDERRERWIWQHEWIDNLKVTFVESRAQSKTDFALTHPSLLPSFPPSPLPSNVPGKGNEEGAQRPRRPSRRSPLPHSEGGQPHRQRGHLRCVGTGGRKDEK